MPNVYPDSWIADPVCRLTLDWLHTTAVGRYPAPVNLLHLFESTFKEVVDSLHTYLATNPAYINAGRRADVYAATTRFRDPVYNPYQTSVPYKEILWTKSAELPPDVVELSARCVSNGVYLPHNHTRESDRTEIQELFEGKGPYANTALFDVDLSTTNYPGIQLGDTTMFSLFTVYPLANLGRDARHYLYSAKRLGILRAYPTKRLHYDPLTVPGTAASGPWGAGPNGKCCANSACQNGLPGQYCGLVDPSVATSGCNSVSDPCS